jgi:hypothetical protein
LSAYLRKDGFFAKMNFDPSEKFGGWYLLDPKADGIEQIMAEECPKNPPVIIADKTEVTDRLHSVLQNWGKGSEDESADEQNVKRESDHEVGSSRCVRKIIARFPNTLQEIFAVERHHVKASPFVSEADSDASSDEGFEDFVLADLPRKVGYVTIEDSRRYFVLENRTLSFYHDALDAEQFAKNLGNMWINNDDNNQTEVIQNDLVSITILSC